MVFDLATFIQNDYQAGSYFEKSVKDIAGKLTQPALKIVDLFFGIGRYYQTGFLIRFLTLQYLSRMTIKQVHNLKNQLKTLQVNLHSLH